MSKRNKSTTQEGIYYYYDYMLILFMTTAISAQNVAYMSERISALQLSCSKMLIFRQRNEWWCSARNTSIMLRVRPKENGRSALCHSQYCFLAENNLRCVGSGVKLHSLSPNIPGKTPRQNARACCTVQA